MHKLSKFETEVASFGPSVYHFQTYLVYNYIGEKVREHACRIPEELISEYWLGLEKDISEMKQKLERGEKLSERRQKKLLAFEQELEARKKLLDSGVFTHEYPEETVPASTQPHFPHHRFQRRLYLVCPFVAPTQKPAKKPETQLISDAECHQILDSLDSFSKLYELPMVQEGYNDVAFRVLTDRWRQAVIRAPWVAFSEEESKNFKITAEKMVVLEKHLRRALLQDKSISTVAKQLFVEMKIAGAKVSEEAKMDGEIAEGMAK